jgi:hypothetical protein
VIRKTGAMTARKRRNPMKAFDFFDRKFLKSAGSTPIRTDETVMKGLGA